MDNLALSAREWVSPYWFRPDILAGFVWDHGWALYLLPLVPALFALRWLLALRYRERVEIAFFGQRPPRDPSAWLRLLPQILLGLALVLFLLALARPQRTSELAEQSSLGIDIMLALDISESMTYEDLAPDRLEAAKEVTKRFIMGRPNDRIGIVLFAGEAFSLCPLTSDQGLLRQYIDDISTKAITQPGTAIGSAIVVAINRLNESRSRSKVLVLISDGDNTAGNIDPTTAAELAQDNGIRIYTIAVGRDGLIPIGRDFFGNPRYEQSNLDETTLRRVAQLGNGAFFRAADRATFEGIMARIDENERSEIKVRRFKQTQDYYTIYLNWGLVLLLGWLALKSTYLTNALED